MFTYAAISSGSPQTYKYFKRLIAMAEWLTCLELCTEHQKVVSSIPHWGPYRKRPTDVCFSQLCRPLSLILFLSFPLSIKKKSINVSLV